MRILIGIGIWWAVPLELSGGLWSSLELSGALWSSLELSGAGAVWSCL